MKWNMLCSWVLFWENNEQLSDRQRSVELRSLCTINTILTQWWILFGKISKNLPGKGELCVWGGWASGGVLCHFNVLYFSQSPLPLFPTETLHHILSTDFFSLSLSLSLYNSFHCLSMLLLGWFPWLSDWWITQNSLKLCQYVLWCCVCL